MNTGTYMADSNVDPGDVLAGAVLEETEKDTLGEIANICMGTCATTLSMLLGKRVTITTPRVTVCRGGEYLEGYEKPVVATEVSYTQGLNGHNIFLIKKDDALLITGLLMDDLPQEEIGDLYLSAMSEVMNQMVGSSSTALADILHVHVNISPPVTSEYSLQDEMLGSKFGDQTLIRIGFRMEIEDLLVSNIMQVMPFNFGKKLAASLMGEHGAEPAKINRPAMPAGMADNERSMDEMSDQELKKSDEKKPMELKTAKFQPFSESGGDVLVNAAQKNIDLIIDVPLQVTVVLGKSRKSIKEILDMGMGSVIVLDRLAGEMVDVLVNGKVFARGEVGVIDDNYGVRITEMMPGQMKM